MKDAGRLAADFDRCGDPKSSIFLSKFDSHADTRASWSLLRHLVGVVICLVLSTSHHKF